MTLLCIRLRIQIGRLMDRREMVMKRLVAVTYQAESLSPVRCCRSWRWRVGRGGVSGAGYIFAGLRGKGQRECTAEILDVPTEDVQQHS